MECKDREERVLSRFLLVLIETLWNVKEDWKHKQFQMGGVLIETLWNVKK